MTAAKYTASVRNEEWGKITYSRDTDEFFALYNSATSIDVARPLSAGCLVTGRCNLSCGFCYGNKEALSANELTPEGWRDIFRNLDSLGLLRVDISGGEPAVRSDLHHIVNFAIDSRLNVVLSTNGMLWNAQRLEKLPRNIRIHVSLDSGFEELHNKSHSLPKKLAGSSHSPFAEASTFIQSAITARFDVRVLTCLGPHNETRLMRLAEHIALLGVSDWNISRILKAGRAKSGQYDLVDEMFVLEQIQLVRETYPWIRVRYSNRTTNNGYFLLVLPDGTMATQYTDDRDKVPIGNARTITNEQLQNSPLFSVRRHGEKWLATAFEEPALLN